MFYHCYPRLTSTFRTSHFLLQHSLVEALRPWCSPQNHPVIFHHYPKTYRTKGGGVHHRHQTKEWMSHRHLLQGRPWSGPAVLRRSRRDGNHGDHPVEAAAEVAMGRRRLLPNRVRRANLKNLRTAVRMKKMRRWSPKKLCRRYQF